MTQGIKVDISPNQDGGIVKEIIRAGPDQADKPWKGDKVQVILPANDIANIKAIYSENCI